MIMIFLVAVWFAAGGTLIFRNTATAANPSKDDCRDVTFEQPIKDKALTGHALANKTAESKEMCDVLCYLEPNCVSTNFQTALGVKLNCELNSQDGQQHPEDMNDMPGAIYQSMKNLCRNQTACTLTNMIGCQSGYGSRGYRCACTKCFQGKSCDQVVDHENIVMQFPTKSITHRVEIKTPFPTALTALTLAMWIQIGPVTTSFIDVPFSYSTSTLIDEFVVYIKRSSVWIQFKSQKTLSMTYPFYTLDPNQWVHLCFTWKSESGVMKGFINGTKYARITDVHSGRTIPEGGLMLGQEQDAFMSGLDASQAFKGNLTSVNVWDHVLSDSRVASLAKACPATKLKGNLLKWGDFFQYKTESVGYYCGTHCRP